LGLIGHNGAGNQAAGQPLGRLPQAARKVNRDLGRSRQTAARQLRRRSRVGTQRIKPEGRRESTPRC